MHAPRHRPLPPVPADPPCSPPSAPPSSRSAFTLAEVGMALAVLALAVVAVALVFPLGLSAQRLARFQLHASARMLAILDHWTNDSHTRWERQVEAEQAPQSTFMRWPLDLDRMFESPVSGLLPLPRELARRIDSDGDEIARLLAEEGELFYVAPHTWETGYDMRVAQDDPLTRGQWSGQVPTPTEAQALVFGVIGYAQQNALPNHPCLAWPYYDFWPAPARPWERRLWEMRATEPVWADGWPAFQALVGLVDEDTYHAASADPAALDAYIVAALDLVADLGIATEPDPGTAAARPLPPTDLASLAPPWSALPTALREHAFPHPARILALRLLAHAAMARTATTLPDPAPDRARFAAWADACHERGLAWAMRYVSADPYDWGHPRPLNRQTCFDFPLLQHDLFAPPIAATDGTGDVCWPVIGPRRPDNHGEARGMYGGWPGVAIPANRAAIDASWGDPTRYDLAARFDPSERARRLACWAVDWRAFEDFESAPSDPADSNAHFLDSRGVCVSSERSGYPPDLRLHFADAARTAVYRQIDKGTMMAGPRYDVWESLPYKQTFLGLHGADRNGNGRFDTGPLPRSARLRAVAVAAVDVYDRVLISSLRN